jgi:hypothetical protein
MWPLNRFPAANIQKKYGFTPSSQWLEQAQLASVRLPGCSGSIVSPSGLVMTNYHRHRLRHRGNEGRGRRGGLEGAPGGLRDDPTRMRNQRRCHVLVAP